MFHQFEIIFEGDYISLHYSFVLLFTFMVCNIQFTYTYSPAMRGNNEMSASELSGIRFIIQIQSLNISLCLFYKVAKC